MQWSLRIGCLLSGALWGLLALAQFPTDSPQVPVFLAFMLAGVLAGGATAMSVDLFAAYSFLWAAYLPLGVRFLMIEDAALFRAMGLSSLLYIAFLSAWTRRMHQNVHADVQASLAAAAKQRELAEREARFRELAQTDALTGLPNRLALNERLPGLLAAAGESGQRVAVACIDLDSFKDINDSRGHGCGDALLIAVGARLRACVRPDDLVVRMGGDEFIVVAGDAQPRAQLTQLMQRLLQAVSEPLQHEGERMEARASLGLAVFPQDGRDVPTLLRHADMALYRAKSIGRNTHQFFTDDMRVAFEERIFIQDALSLALQREELHLEYQPLVDLGSGRMTGLEALLRWRHPERGLIPPMDFIPVAEHCGLINALGERVLRLVCRQLGAWQQAGVPLLPMSVNVSPWQFEHGRLVEVLRAVSAECGVRPSLLQVEITETALITGNPGESRTIEQLRELGVRIMIDDFGVGYSSLSHLKNLQIDGLKIDRSFVRDMTVDARDAAIVHATVGIGRSLDIAVLAEGVESAAHVAQLQALGCAAGQGNFLHPPVAAAEAAQLLRRTAAGAALVPA
jgi:diguanylate cyclase (GGDEF)-like protein